MTNSTSRPVIYGTQGVISSGHYLTSMAGMRMLLSGGNAFDAIVAARFCRRGDRADRIVLVGC